MTTACHVSKDAGSPEAGAAAECAVGAEGTGDGAVRRSLSPRPLNRSRGSRRGANTAAPPINNPGMSAASTIAAPAATAPRVAMLPMTRGRKTELKDQSLVCVKGFVKELSPFIEGRGAVRGYK